MARVQWSPAATKRREAAVIPERLQFWFVEDWIDDDEPVPLFAEKRTPLEQREALILLSRSRFVRARADHLHKAEAAGQPIPAFPPVGRPRWRNPDTRKAPGDAPAGSEQ